MFRSFDVCFMCVLQWFGMYEIFLKNQIQFRKKIEILFSRDFSAINFGMLLRAISNPEISAHLNNSL